MRVKYLLERGLRNRPYFASNFKQNEAAMLRIAYVFSSR